MPESANPAVSIVMPCHDAAPYLPSSVGSVLAQTFADWELIAVDDGSSDGTLAWLQQQSDRRIRIQAQSNQGVSAARNAGLAGARGRYVAFLDADDTWHPGFVARMLEALEDRPDAALAYCGWQNFGLVSRRGEPFVPPDYENAAKAETLFTGCRWPIHAALTRRVAIVAAGGFDPALKNAEDYALWLRVANSAPIVRVPEVLAYYHFHDGGQASANRARAALNHLKAQRRFLEEHPEFEAALGRKKVRTMMLNELLDRGNACYWKRDLAAARTIFRAVMKHGHGNLGDWCRMLPAWLPESWHRSLLGLRAGRPRASSE